MSTETHVKGLADLQKFLDQLPAKVERNIMRSALRAGAKVVRPVAKANIHSVSGELAASLDHKRAIGTKSRGGTVTAYLRAGTGFGVKGKPPKNLPRWVEYGTRPHSIKPRRGGALAVLGRLFESVEHPGARPRPFMRPALDSQAGAVLIAVGEQIKKRLTKEGLNASGVMLEGDE